MENKRMKSVSARRGFLPIAAVSVVCMAVVVFACFQYYYKLQSTVKAESGDYLQEISKQTAVNAGKTIDDNFTILESVATVLKAVDAENFIQIGKITRKQEESWNFERILLVAEDGTAYDTNGHKELLPSDDYLREVIVSRNRAMSTSQMMGSTECVVFALPVDGLLVGNVKISAVAATYNLATFDQLLSMTAFDGKGYGHIIRHDGTVVIRSSSEYAQPCGYNILSALEEADFKGKVGLKQTMADIANGRAGQAELIMGGEAVYMSYTPIAAREWCLLTFVPTAIANAKTKLLFNITLLLSAAIALVFCVLLAFIMVTLYRHKRKLEELAYIDPVTGGNTMQRFYNDAESILSEGKDEKYALVYTNISKFKILNEQLGRVACDVILKTVCKCIQSNLTSDECLGRHFADNFCVLIEYKNEETLKARLEIWNNNYSAAVKETEIPWLPLSVDIGVYVIENNNMPITDMIDRAKLALRETTVELDAQLHYKIYDEKVRRRIVREKQIEDMMESALARNEFQVYLQPKYHTETEKVGGAEALVRWKSRSDGMIYPDEFIPLFEKNGFIIKLDLWVFEKVCQTLRGWIDIGQEPVRISVNCSRIHLKTPGFLDKYKAIAQKYSIPPRLLEIELTENVVFEDVVHLTKIIEEIHEIGFSCSMDDFGSGHSSLNLIRDIPVDVLKLDRIFFRTDGHNSSRTESVVGCIITMAQALSMDTVAEGVEEKPQLEMLRRLGCDYIQGYYFAKPMPISEFEKLTFGKLISKIN